MRRPLELRAGGAPAGGEVEPLGVEPDRPPHRARRSMSGEPRELSLAERVGRGEEPLFGLPQRRFALARGEHVRRRKRGRAAEPAVEMHVVDSKRKHGEIGEAGIEPGLGIAAQIPGLGARRGASFDATAKRHARMVERVAAFRAPGHEQGRARIVRQIPGMARERREEEERGAVEIAGDADERRERRASRLECRQGAGAGEPHQPLGVGDGARMGLIQISGGVRHDGLDAWGGLE